ncbi:SDR family oxidoreductase [Pantoea rodasii]|uniref:SDR family oxidoreductase n=1 Tax=Pantoea rodasii TaxID=1076549 RepID=UPI001FCCC838|nr:SDR family oxidoreductase [Pantoea rodasii]
MKLLASDHQVYAIGRKPATLQALEALTNVVPVALDITDFSALATFTASLRQVDILVHSAAISVPSTTLDATPDLWQQHLNINVVAPAELTRQLLPALRQSHGKVVFINSGSGTLALAGHVVYSASKFALTALAHALRTEESEHGVRVATVAPGPTDTPMNQRSREQQGNLAAIDPRDYLAAASVARAVRFIVDSPEDTQIADIVVRPRRDKAQR